MNNQSRRIGLLAGSGEIPIYFAARAAQSGIRIVAVSFTDEIHSQLAPFVEKGYSIGVGKAGKILRTFKEEGITDLVMLGKVDKKVIFRPELFDLHALKILKQVVTKEDKTLLLAVIREMEKEGLCILDQRELLGAVFPAAGLLTRRKPSKQEMEDIEFGLPIAKSLADMEIGQTIVVKDKTVVAVEAVEGTDRALERGCELSRGKCVAVKVSRTDQDYRYDVPGIGPQTLEYLAKGGASVLALEAGRIMVVDQPKVVELADRAKIAVVCV
ncbi:MAG: UDP-2,3-diacylglucosamine diphosphatase LpxI [Nitrospinae bacterium]|nr:UDP-2,3-diacylglucosamine diphosphatase LpxI [Nitrospinota bacterium]